MSFYRVLAYIFLFIFVSIASIILFSLAKSGCEYSKCSEPLGFDKYIWMKSKECHPRNYTRLRSRMLNDLIPRIQNLSKDQIIEMLGTPLSHDKFGLNRIHNIRNSELVYCLGWMKVDILFPFIPYEGFLLIDIDEDSIYYGYRVIFMGD